jgi:hypothetical protein
MFALKNIRSDKNEGYHYHVRDRELSDPTPKEKHNSGETKKDYS